MPRVAISLVTWNGLKYLPQCFNSILSQTYQDWSLCVLDNGSTDGSAKYIRELDLTKRLQKDRLEIIYQPSNLGFASAHNLVVNSTSSDYVLVLNQDVILDPNFLKIIVNFLDNHPNVGGVTGKILKWAFTSDADNEYLRDDSLTDIIDSTGLRIFKNHRVIESGVGEQDSGQYDSDREVFGIPATCAVYRRSALDAVRLPRVDTVSKKSKNIVWSNSYEYFDENFFSYKEDIDLSYRMRLLGLEFWYLKDARAYHDRTAKSIADLSDSAVVRHRYTKSPFINYHSYKNHLFILIKNVTPRVLLRYGVFIKWYEFKKFIWLLLNERATLVGLKEVFKNLHSMAQKRKFIMSRRKCEIVKWLE